MAESTGDVYASGTAASMCAISPSDEVGIINNLMTRIEKLEQAVNALAGVNISAGKLSDLSQQVGWVYGVDYMGVPGWAQTEYGSLVPPAGFTLSGAGFTLPNACTGEDTPYQGVVMDENGVLQFGFTPTGTLCGEKVQAWNDAAAATGAAPDYALYKITSGASPVSSSRGITAIGAPLNGEGTATFTVSQDGIYWVNCHFQATTISGTPLVTFFIKSSNTTYPQTVALFHHPEFEGTAAEVHGMFRLYSGESVSATYDSSTGGVSTAATSEYSIYRISAI